MSKNCVNFWVNTEKTRDAAFHASEWVIPCRHTQQSIKNTGCYYRVIVQYSKVSRRPISQSEGNTCAIPDFSISVSF